MGETINILIKFISEDPIMLGLCFAIIVLIIIFILVLIFGGRKEKKIEEKTIPIEDNTQTLLKTTIDDEPLRSTQEYSFNMNSELNSNVSDTQSLENIQILGETSSEEIVPITVDEAMELKNKREMEALKNTIEMPVLTDMEPEQEIKYETNTTVDSTFSDENKESGEKKNQPLSPIYTSSDNKPEIEPSVRSNETTNADSEDIDIDLPKLKSEPRSSIFDTLSGEKFNINNNHK